MMLYLISKDIEDNTTAITPIGAGATFHGTGSGTFEAACERNEAERSRHCGVLLFDDFEGETRLIACSLNKSHRIITADGGGLLAF